MSDARPILEVTTALGEDIAAFTRRNDAASRFDSGLDPSAWYSVARDDPALAGLRLLYRDGTCDYAFPPGRFLEVAQGENRVRFITYVMPLRSLGFPEALVLAGEVRADLARAGWAETRWYPDVSREKIENTPGPKEAWLGRWRPCGRDGQEAGLSVKDAGQEFVGTSVPLGAQVREEPAGPDGAYVLLLEIYKSLD